MSAAPMPAWAQTMQGALVEAISDLRAEMNVRFDAVDRSLATRAEGEGVNTDMAGRAERLIAQAREDLAGLSGTILKQQKLIQTLERRIAALESKAA